MPLQSTTYTLQTSSPLLYLGRSLFFSLGNSSTELSMGRLCCLLFGVVAVRTDIDDLARVVSISFRFTWNGLLGDECLFVLGLSNLVVACSRLVE